MYNYATAAKALSIAVASTCMIACSYGTSRSSSNQFVDNQQDKPVVKIDDLNLEPLAIDQQNLYTAASLTLKAVVLTDSSATALDRSANVSRNNVGILNSATGVTIELDPIPCTEGGQVKITGQVNNSDTSNLQPINFDNSLNWALDTEFDRCTQAGSSLTGEVEVLFSMNISELLNTVRYSFDATMYVTEMLMEQPGLDPVTVNGSYEYQVDSYDGINVTTEVKTNDTLYTSEYGYQILDYTMVKQANNETKAYSYSIASKFSASFMDSSYVEYQTVQPLRGTGYAYPSSGKLMVFGGESTMYITAMENDAVLIELDMGKDGTIDLQEYSTWSDLLLDPRSQPEF